MVPTVRTAIVAGVLVATAGAAAAAPVARAGEWESTIGGRTNYVCLPKDRTFDIDGLSRIMPMGGGKCSPVSDLHTAGTVTTFTIACDVAGGHMTTHNTLTVTSDQAYTMHVTSHLEGGTIKMDDMDLTQVARRTGECQPRDRMARDY
jgi:hypothetical protein